MIETIFVPRGSEEGAVRGALRETRTTGVRVIATGIGPIAAARAADEALAEGRFGTSLVTGLCGALSSTFVVGDVLAYRSITRASGRDLYFERGLTERIARSVPGALSGVRAYASDAIVTSAGEKSELARARSAAAVDMETLAIGDRLARAGVAVAALRVVSDEALRDIPPLERALNGSGGIDDAALALALLRRPLAGARFAAGAIVALRALRGAVAAALRG